MVFCSTGIVQFTTVPTLQASATSTSIEVIWGDSGLYYSYNLYMSNYTDGNFGLVYLKNNENNQVTTYNSLILPSDIKDSIPQSRSQVSHPSPHIGSNFVTLLCVVQTRSSTPLVNIYVRERSCGISFISAMTTFAGQAQPQTFNYTGTLQTYTVPLGIHTVAIQAVG